MRSRGHDPMQISMLLLMHCQLRVTSLVLSSHSFSSPSPILPCPPWLLSLSQTRVKSFPTLPRCRQSRRCCCCSTTSFPLGLASLKLLKNLHTGLGTCLRSCCCCCCCCWCEKTLSIQHHPTELRDKKRYHKRQLLRPKFHTILLCLLLQLGTPETPAER